MCDYGGRLGTLKCVGQAVRKHGWNSRAWRELLPTGALLLLHRRLSSAVKAFQRIRSRPPRLSRIISVFKVSCGIQSYLLNAFTAMSRLAFGWITVACGIAKLTPNWPAQCAALLLVRIILVPVVTYVARLELHFSSLFAFLSHSHPSFFCN